MILADRNEERDLPLNKRIWNQYEKGQKFNDQFNINRTVEVNENFFIGS